MKTRIFVHNGSPWTVACRGGPVFDRWAGLGLPVHTGPGWEPGWPTNDLYLLVSLPINPAMLDLIRRLKTPGNAVIVDVCFPFHRPDEIEPLQPGAMAGWTDPANRRVAEACMAEADHLTTTYPDWAVELRRYNPNTLSLPDCTDPKITWHFGRMLEVLWDNPPRRPDPTLP